MTQGDIELFKAFTAPFIGLPLTHLWQGYGSAIFLEFGALTPCVRANGSVANNMQGEFGFHVECSWRIEGKRRVWLGSWSETDRWPQVLSKLVGCSVTSIEMFGHLGEVSILFTNGLRLVTFTTVEGDPEWAAHNSEHVYISVKAGRLVVDMRAARNARGVIDA